MNYLAHAFLAGRSPGFVAGSIIGDFMRGQRLETFPTAVQAGIRMHRRTDAYTDGHPAVARGRRRFAPPYRRYAGVLLDVLFDHFLARDWDRFSPGEPLDHCAARTYEALAAHQPHLPSRLSRVLPVMARENWLAAYVDIEQVGRAFQGISGRLRHANPVAGAMVAVEPVLDDLAGDFAEFFPECLVWAEAMRGKLLLQVG